MSNLVVSVLGFFVNESADSNLWSGTMIILPVYVFILVYCTSKISCKNCLWLQGEKSETRICKTCDKYSVVFHEQETRNCKMVLVIYRI
jgi:hypothetical protein